MTKNTIILLNECGKKHRDQEVLPSKLVMTIKRCMVKFHSRKISFREPPAYQEEIVVTNSDSDSDVDYIPGGSGTDESNDSCSWGSSILSEEQKDLLIGVVELIGRETCDSGSFFHCQTELPWRKQMQNFIAQQESQGYCLKILKISQ